MPAQKKQSPEDARDNLVYLLSQLDREMQKHYELADPYDFPTTFVHRAGGRFQHYSEYDRDALEQEYEAFGEKFQAVTKALEGKSWRPNFFGTVQSVKKLAKHVEKYLDIFEQDYCYRGMLWKGGSLGVSDEVRQAADEARGAANKMQKNMERLQLQIEKAYKTVEKGLSDEQPIAKSPKAKRAEQTKTRAKKM